MTIEILAEQTILFVFSMTFMIAPFMVLAVISAVLHYQRNVYRVANWPNSNDWIAQGGCQ